MRILACVLALLTATAAHAEGFAVRDLTSVVDEAKAALGPGFQHRAAPERLTLMCLTCEGGPMVDVLLGRQPDGTEQRVRSGETTFESLERRCKEREPACRLSGLDVAPAVGWITSYPMGKTFGATAVVIRDGDLLTIRSIASSANAARANAETLASKLAPQIVGR
ncbi:hypothetical protein [Methylopila sp. M107]|uniref:hypothetical protein n=1 Tax=Methylopila sp. M107 TaxID=1101190 RepID=UPI000376833A|nr:hypothetical protein [Methylopila sp. M107]